MKISFSGTEHCSFGKKGKDVSENLTSSIFRVGEINFSAVFIHTVVGESENSHKQGNTGSREVILQVLNCRPWEDDVRKDLQTMKINPYPTNVENRVSS